LGRPAPRHLRQVPRIEKDALSTTASII
jgi:hypothetical protein